MQPFLNKDDSLLLAQVDKARQERERSGLGGLVGDLEAVIISTEPDHFVPAVQGLLATTGHDVLACWSRPEHDACLLELAGSPGLLVRSRKQGANPFTPYNRGAKNASMPNTRLETFVFSCQDVKAYQDIQHRRGVAFLDAEARETDTYVYAQTMPSRFTGNAIGVIEFKKARGDFLPAEADPLETAFAKLDKPYLKAIGKLDHVAARVRAEERDAAILEFMGLTGYDFAFSVYVDFLNSITNVARLAKDGYAQVFTSGIAPFASVETSGPTELFIHNYGPRSHHMAFATEPIEDTVAALGTDGLGFLSELVGSRQEGLKQIFTKMSPHTLLVNEYIHRYDGFDGFFTKSNVTLLTQATQNQ